jgi:hypothetical protein
MITGINHIIHASGLAARIAAAKAQPWNGLEFFA